MSIRGINSENDSELINETLVSCCDKLGIEFIRWRPCKSSVQALVEQKNGAIIRKLLEMWGATGTHHFGERP